MQHKGKEVRIRYLPFPATVQGSIFGFLSERNSCYLIGIDSTRTRQKQRQTLGHELAHLFLDHLDRHDLSIKELEAEADEMSWYYYSAYRSGIIESL